MYNKKHLENIDKATELIRKAHHAGANIILLQELFETTYFCQTEKYELFDLAEELDNSSTIKHFQKASPAFQDIKSRHILKHRAKFLRPNLCNCRQNDILLYFTRLNSANMVRY